MADTLVSENRWNHDVFLSFRGPDTRNTFTGHLYRALVSKGINVFIDTELQRGQVITSQLLRVIQESRLSIVVLSEKYASSSFCLDELVMILECGVSKGQIVIPVFYDVDPTDVEEQRGTFGQEFAKLEAQINYRFNNWKLFPSRGATFLRYVMKPTVDDSDEKRNNDEEAMTNTERVHKWRLALTEVARLSGWHIRKGDHESNIIQDIVKKVSKKLDYTPLHVAEYPVRLTSRVEYIIQKLNMESCGVSMVGLYGMGGVGKTTTARALYNSCVSRFEFDGCCFLSRVRENSKPPHVLAELQQTLVSEILGVQEHLIKNSEKGIELIKRRFPSKKVLIVIDDVDHLKQLQQLAGGLEWFGGGSVIIITTRDSHLLEHHGVTIIHEIKQLEFDEALELFSWHAFKKPEPDEAYTEFSSRLIRYTRGLPLALTVLGSSLYKKSAPQWDDMLKKLKRCPNEEIDEVLKVSYDSLDSEEKAMFLDIAFFFKGKHKDEVTKFLDVCGFGAHFGIQRLVENSLIYVESEGTLEMHDLLEAMGTKISLEEFSRLCIREKEDVFRMFVKDKSSYDVEILVLDLNGEEDEPLTWLENLTKLRALVILNGHFTEMPKTLPKSIKWLEWHNCGLNSIPSEFLPPNLVVIEMPCNIIVDMPKAQKFMNLTRMDFKGSKHLKETMDFLSIPNLQVLDFTDSRKIKTIHKSIGSLKKLEKLKLEGCLRLENLPNLIENQSLVSIDLSYCWNLENMPKLPTSITQLNLHCSGLKEIPLFIGNLINLEDLKLGGCFSLTTVPSLVENRRLVSIDLSFCSKLEHMPNLPTTITQLNFEYSGIKEIPLFIGNLINLKYIDASNCENLICVSNSIYNLPNIYYLKMRNCPNLPQFPETESSEVSSDLTSTTINRLDLSGNAFVSLPVNTFKFIHIRSLCLEKCEWLVEIPELPDTLEELKASNCKSLVRFSQFQFDRFRGDFSNCHKMAELEKND